MVTGALRSKAFLIILATFGVLVFTPLSFAGKYNGVSAFAAVGSNFTVPGSLRVGYKDVEVGLLSPFMIGFAKAFHFDSKYFTQLGFGYMGVGPAVSAAIHSSIGFYYDIFWGLSLRGEVFAQVNTASAFHSSGLLGVTWGF